VLQEAARDYSLPAHTGEITLGEQQPNCPTLLGDPLLIHRVVCNLIFNAIKHNGPETHVFLDAQVDKSGSHVLFSCRDNGNGVAPDILPTIFTEFVTTGDSCSKSTGLGLAFCRAAVEAHRGRIWCENSTQGAAFLFTIPMHKEHKDGH
jgi:two-component system sensor histidine kinase KdpD